MYLSDLPTELHLNIYYLLNDTVDALSLSSTSSYFRGLFRGNRLLILKTIILCSDVYEYEILAFNFLETNRALSKQRLIAHENPDDIAAAFTPPTEDPFLACLDHASMDPSALTDDLVEDVCRRYNQAMRLACLYEMLSTELDTMYSRLITVDCPEDVTACLDPGSVIPSLYPFAAERRFSNNPTFRSRFCKAVCLQAIATTALSVARTSRFLDDEAGDLVCDNMVDIFTQQLDDICESASPLSWQERLECIEVRDFLYTFLLSKIVPLQAIESWWIDTEDYWLIADGLNEPFHGPWGYTLVNFRQSLTPYDILDLVVGQSWDPDKAYPPDKTAYIYTLGIMEDGPDHPYDWFTVFGRLELSQRVDPKHRVPKNCMEHPTRWDYARAQVGSPFKTVYTFQLFESGQPQQTSREKRMKRKKKHVLP